LVFGPVYTNNFKFIYRPLTTLADNAEVNLLFYIDFINIVFMCIVFYFKAQANPGGIFINGRRAYVNI
jgi:hypothetical protein